MTEQPVENPEDWATAFGQFLSEHPGPNVNHEKMRPMDDMWHAKEQERQAVVSLNTQIESNVRGQALAEKVFTLKASPGWEPYVKELEKMRAQLRVELELCNGTDTDFRILQGRCRALGGILALMRDCENTLKGLAEQLHLLEESKAKYVRADGKLLPQGV